MSIVADAKIHSVDTAGKKHTHAITIEDFMELDDIRAAFISATPANEKIKNVVLVLNEYWMEVGAEKYKEMLGKSTTM